MSAKSISQFLPLAASTREECDRHYRQVHTRYARSFLREMDHVRSYHVGLAEAAYDLNCRWCAKPETFRYVTLRFDPGTTLQMGPELREAITQDHRMFLRELRGFAVEEEVLVDRLYGQTSLVKYLFEYDRPPDEEVGVGAARLAEQLRELVPLTGEAFGLRLLLADHVVSEGLSAAVDEPGQRPTGVQLDQSSRQAFLELYFDQQQWAEEWFVRPDVRRALLGGGWGAARGARIREECGLDRR